MAQFSKQEQDNMRQAAMRRAQEMQKRVHQTEMPGGQPFRAQFADVPPESPRPNASAKTSSGRRQPLAGLLPMNAPNGLLSHLELDGDTMLILAMMVMLYKDGGWDGCDKKLLMALAYLLT